MRFLLPIFVSLSLSSTVWADAASRLMTGNYGPVGCSVDRLGYQAMAMIEGLDEQRLNLTLCDANTFVPSQHCDIVAYGMAALTGAEPFTDAGQTQFEFSGMLTFTAGFEKTNGELFGNRAPSSVRSEIAATTKTSTTVKLNPSRNFEGVVVDIGGQCAGESPRVGPQ